MTTKKMLMAGTIALLITLNGGVLKDGVFMALASPLTLQDRAETQEKEENASEAPETAAVDPLHAVLGVESDKQVYDALYEGRSLAEVADANGGDVEALISLQVSQLTQQLAERLAAGTISAEIYDAQKQELREIITASTYSI